MTNAIFGLSTMNTFITGGKLLGKEVGRRKCLPQKKSNSMEGDNLTIFWEHLRYTETKEGRFYKILNTAETDEKDPTIPKFKNERPGDIILGHHNLTDGKIEAYLIE